MQDCLFCKIVAQELPAHVIAQGERAIAILDIHPVHLGHALILPKQHSETLLDASQEDRAAMIELAAHVAQHLQKTLGVSGVNMLHNAGAVSGQIIPHAHVHVIPRYENDGLKHWPSQNVTHEDLAAMAHRLRA